MTYVRPQLLRFALPAYLVGGLLIGAAVTPLKHLAATHFGRAGFAVAFVVNVAMPLLVIVLAGIYPRLHIALAGTLMATLAFLLAIGLKAPPLRGGWLRNLLGQMGPILVVASIAYHLLAAATVGVLRPVRRVGFPPKPDACSDCGYLLIGVAGLRCPECGLRHTVVKSAASVTDP